MAKTRHIARRMSQRGIKSEVLDMVSKFGVRDGDKLILNRKACQAIRETLDKLKRTIGEIEEKGGYVLVECGGTQITTYRLDSYAH